MKKSIAVLAIIVAMRGIVFAEAERTARINVGLDLFGVGNFKDPFESDTESAANELAELGYSATGNTTTKGAVGGRAGVTFPVGNNFFLGGSLGFIGGLDAKQTLTGTSSTLGNVSITSETKVRFLRFLVEGVKKLPVSDAWGFSLGAGLGLANGHADIDSSVTGIDGESGSKSKNWTGFTWEVSPAVYFTRANTDFSVGLRYAQFPKLDESDENDKIQWNTVGLFAGLTF